MIDNNYKVFFGGYAYHVNAISKQHAKTKVYNQIKKTEPTFMGDVLISSNDIKVKELFK